MASELKQKIIYLMADNAKRIPEEIHQRLEGSKLNEVLATINELVGENSLKLTLDRQLQTTEPDPARNIYLQPGRLLYECQVIDAQIRNKEEIPLDKIHNVALETCKLISALGRYKEYVYDLENKIRRMESLYNDYKRDMENLICGAMNGKNQ